MKKEGHKYLTSDSYKPEIRKFDIENSLLSNAKGVLDIDKVLEDKNYTRDQLLIAKLVLAEQAYLSGFDKMGDKLVKSVVKAKDKGKDVLYYLECLNNNKKLLKQKAKHQNKFTLVKIKKVNEN